MKTMNKKLNKVVFGLLLIMSFSLFAENFEYEKTPSGAKKAIYVTPTSGDFGGGGGISSYSYTPVFSTVTCSDPFVWYAYTIPANTVGITISAREGYDFRISKDSNGATYELIFAGDSFNISHASGTFVTGTLYLNSPDKYELVLQIRCLKKE